MGRWEPNTRLKLIDAAVELFAANGYEATTVLQIAAQAGVSKMTFFRHFADKREVLFAGQAEFVELLRDSVSRGPKGAGALAVAAAAVTELAAVFPVERQAPTARLNAVVASHPDLRERSAYKRALLTAALEGALLERQVPAATAGVAADVAVRALHDAFDRWAEPGQKRSLPELIGQALGELTQAATELVGH
ncbi:TetR family transcriptional regulator [Kineosporia sp. NBRC 101677]|uniref:TetR/AcrR family transcriptional regulator n=1 Tax=Kineosporia sp. NBRC 101677 TaxID=3032197 RepID=UPI0024A4EA01|nr:TetR/AcrR family transcriptional regulator [Kineosporia sp. NBRC 101677]GLY13749.1 TetR family transcriptional regulator [Kineosporia sp. NBRC 101677]